MNKNKENLVESLHKIMGGGAKQTKGGAYSDMDKYTIAQNESEMYYPEPVTRESLTGSLADLNTGLDDFYNANKDIWAENSRKRAGEVMENRPFVAGDPLLMYGAMQSSRKDSQYSDEGRDEYYTAKYFANSANRVLNALTEENKDDTSAFESITQQIKDRSVSDYITLGYNEPVQLAQALIIAMKSSNGGKLTDGEQKVLSAFNMFIEAEDIVAQEGGYAPSAYIGDGLSKAFDYIGQMGLTAGVGSWAAKGGSKAAKWAAKKAGVNLAKRSTGKLMQEAAEELGEKAVYKSVKQWGANAVKTAGAVVKRTPSAMVATAAQTPFMSGTYSNYANEALSQYEFIDLNSDDNIKAELVNPKSQASVIYKAYASGFAEVFTEKLGNVLEPLKVLNLPMNKSLGEMSARISRMMGANMPSVQKVYKGLQKHVNFNGMRYEISEELLNNTIEPLLTGEPERLKENWSKENVWRTIYVTASVASAINVSTQTPAMINDIAISARYRKNAKAFLNKIGDETFKKNLFDALSHKRPEDKIKAISQIDVTNVPSIDRAYALDYIESKINAEVYMGASKENDMIDKVSSARKDFISNVNEFSGNIEYAKMRDGEDVVILGDLDIESGDGMVYARNLVDGNIRLVAKDQIEMINPMSYDNYMSQQMFSFNSDIQMQEDNEMLADIVSEGKVLGVDVSERVAEHKGIDLTTLADNEVTLIDGTQLYVKSVNRSNGEVVILGVMDNDEGVEVDVPINVADIVAVNGGVLQSDNLNDNRSISNLAENTEQENQVSDPSVENVVMKLPKSALEQIPTDVKGNQIYESVDSELATDALLEQTSGDQELALTIANSMFGDKKAEVNRLTKSKLKGGVSVAEKIALGREREIAIKKAKEDLEAWGNIVNVLSLRAQAEQEQINTTSNDEYQGNRALEGNSTPGQQWGEGVTETSDSRKSEEGAGRSADHRAGVEKNIRPSEIVSESRSEREGSEQVTDEQRNSDSAGVATDSTREVEGTRDRGDIRVFEKGLATQRDDNSEYSERDRRTAESERLVGVAKENDLFIPLNETEELGELYSKRTGESLVYINNDRGLVYKVKNPYAKAALKKGVQPEDVIYEHQVHNLLFPEAIYTFEGITEDMGDVRIVLSQKLVNSISQPSQEEIVEALAKRGLYPEDNYSFGSELVSVTDVEGDNVMLNEDGEVCFIDPIIRFKKPVKQIMNELLGADNISMTKMEQIDQSLEEQSQIEVHDNFTVEKRLHKKNGTYIHAVKFTEQMARDKFLDLKKRVKDFGGYYSSFGKGGFIFKNDADAHKFANAVMDKSGELLDDAKPLSIIDTRNVIGENLENSEVNGNNNQGAFGLVDDERMEELKARLRKKLAGQLNVGIDPEILAIGMELAAGYIDRGIFEFGDFANRMIDDIGDVIRPYVKAFYNGARDLPEIVDNGLSEQLTPYDQVRAFDVVNLNDNAPSPADVSTIEQEILEEARLSERNIVNNRNSKRRRKNEQTESDTKVIASQAETVASQAEFTAQNSENEEELNKAISSIDDNIDIVNKQLALLGYYEADIDDNLFNESYGYMRTAEKKAVKNANELANKLVADLGIDPVLIVDKKGKKRRSIAEANIAPAGGDVGIRLPLDKDKELYISIGLTPDYGNEIPEKRDSLKISRDILYRIENPKGIGVNKYGHNFYADPNVEYKDFLSRIKEIIPAKYISQESDYKDVNAVSSEVKISEILDSSDEIINKQSSNHGLHKTERTNSGRSVRLPQRESIGRRPDVEIGLGEGLQESGDDGSRNRTISQTSERSEVQNLRSVGRIQGLRNVNNNHSERGVDHAPASVEARFNANIKAIQLSKQLIENGERATKQQMEVLRKFSGWGGLGRAFNVLEKSRQLQELLGADDYDKAVMSANSSYYTPAYVVDALWDIAHQVGFKGGNILEGSAGIGNILGQMPMSIKECSDIHAIEIDTTAGGILSLLYPDSKIEIQGFEDTRIENGSVDLAITNVPFVTGLRVVDKTGDNDLSKKFVNIHDFCIAKNVRKLRDGGIGIFITSNGTLDNSKSLRDWVVSDGNADFVGAFRMNNKTFVGTAVTSDIIVIRKRVDGRKSLGSIDVSVVSGERTAEYNTGETRKVKGVVTPIVKQLSMDYNKYFIDNPKMMAGTMQFAYESGDTYRPTSKGLYSSVNINQEQLLQDFVNSFSDMYEDSSIIDDGKSDVVNVYENLGADIKEGSVLIDSKGNLAIAQYGKAVPLSVNTNKVKGQSKVDCFKAYSKIKTALADVLNYQINNVDNKGLDPLLVKLNKAYDSFVNTYGYFNKNTAIAFLRNDVDFANVISLERYEEVVNPDGSKIAKYAKADVFSKRVIEKEKEAVITNVKDGVISSVYKFGKIDAAYIASQLGEQVEDVKRDIIDNGYGFENPLSRQIEISYMYLSGNVIEKLRCAQSNNDNGLYDNNIKALMKVVPKEIPAHLIDFTLGSSWIDPVLYNDYVKDKTDISVKFTSVGGTWFMDTPGYIGKEKNRAMGVVSQLLNKTIFGHSLIEAAIQNKTITVSQTIKDVYGQSETITDKDATQACSAKIDEIRQDFKEWARERMQSDPEMSKHIERTYNDMFNNYVPLTIPDEFVPEYFGGAIRSKKMRVHQGRAIVRGTMQSMLLAHEVGTGKTYTLISTAMEMRRLGTARKPMIVVQNATVGQFVESAKELYPNAKILTLEDSDRNAEGRRNFYAKIKYNDWDMIVVPQSTFEFIPDSEERQMEFVKSRIEEKMRVIEQMKSSDPQGNNFITRQAEKEVDQLHEQLAQLTDSNVARRNVTQEKKKAITLQNAEVKAFEMLDRRTDDVENFDDMGIDALLVDEAHEYKHLGFSTAMQRGVKGVDPSYSKKSQGVYLKTQAVMENNNGRNVIFATGTPISNTAAEIWTFMRYLMPEDTMKEYGIYYFDDFVRNFGNIQQMLEFSTSGKYRENNRFAGYVNLPELVRIWSGVSDTVLTEDAEGVVDKIPQLEKDREQDIYLPQTRALRTIMKYVRVELEKYEKMSGKEKKENSHIPLTMYGIAKAAAVDARLVDRNALDDVNSKTNEAVRQTLRSLNDSSTYKGTIAIFADNYQNSSSGFNLYDDIRDKLVNEGVSPNEIVIMRSGMTVKRKLDIFDKVNKGEIRVILGSTFTLGTGVNIQERLHTLIHLDAPNRPMDYTQRNGRILRQGNIHKQMNVPVRILRFGVEDSLDVTAYQRLKTKGAIADSIMRGKNLMNDSMSNRILEEEEDVFGDTVAQLSGSEYAMLKNNAEKNVRKYESRRKQWEADQKYIYHQKRKLQGLINESEVRTVELNKYLELVQSNFKDGKFNEIIIGKHKFTNLDQMVDFFKEYNKSIKDESSRMKDHDGSNVQDRRLSVVFDQFSFEVKTELHKELSRNKGQLISEVHRKMSYVCPELGIINPVPVKQGFLRNAVEDIVYNVITGKDFKEELDVDKRRVENYNSELKQLLLRDGKGFEHEDELHKAKSQLAEYSELMKQEMAEKEAKYSEIDNSVDAIAELSEVREEDDVRYRSANVLDDQSIESALSKANEQFNQELEQLINGTLPRDHIFYLGMPSESLLSIGIPDLPIELASSRLSSKAIQENHPFDLSEIRDLPYSIQNPLAVFRSATRIGSFVVMTEIEHKGENFIVAIQTNSKKGRIEVNSIRSIHYRTSNNHMANWITEGLLEYVDKTRMPVWLSKQRYNSADVRNLYRHATNVVKKFENPTDQGFDQSDYNKIAAVKALAKEFNTNVNIVNNINELPKNSKRKGSKGFYNPRTSEVTIIVPNNSSVGDIQATFLHEVVGHMGMAKLLGAENSAQFYDGVYRKLSESAKQEVIKYELKNSLPRHIAVEEYFATIAEGDVSLSVMQRVLAFVRDFFKRFGINLRMSDNDIRYMLWRSANNLRRSNKLADYLSYADRNNSIRDKLGIDYNLTKPNTVADLVNLIGKIGPDKYRQYYMNNNIHKDQDIDDADLRYKKIEHESEDRDDPVALLGAPGKLTFAKFERQLIDSTNAIKMFQKKIIDLGGVVDIDSEVHSALYRRDSIAKAKADMYFKRYIKPILSVVEELQSKYNISKKGIEDYLLAKSSKERYDISEIRAFGSKNWNETIINEHIDKFEDMVDLSEVDRLWKAIREANNATLKNLYDAGLLSTIEYKSIQLRGWDHYVPLRGWDFDAEGTFNPEENFKFTRSKGDKRMKAIMHAKGRNTKAADPLATIWHIAASSIAKCEDNIARQHFLKLAQDNKGLISDFKVTDNWYAKDELGEWRLCESEPSRADIDKMMAQNKEIKSLQLKLSALDKAKSKNENVDETEIEKLHERIEQISSEVVLARNNKKVYDPPYTKSQQKEKQIEVMKNGVKYTIYLPDPELSRVFISESRGNTLTDYIINKMSVGTRYMSSIATSRNPGFVVPNYVRDVQQAANHHLVDKEGNFVGFMKYTGLRNVNGFDGKVSIGSISGSAVNRNLRGNASPLTVNELMSYNIQDPSQREFLSQKYGASRVYDTLYEMFLEAGGETGYAHIDTVKDIDRKLTRAINGNDLVKAWDYAGAQLNNLAVLSENSTRFASFLAILDTGRGIKSAANYAKNATVNFNIKGAWMLPRALYSFFNASIQGTMTQVRLFKNNPAAYSLSSMLLAGMGYLNYAMLRALDFTDDDEQLSDYDMMNNLCLPIFSTGLSVKIPLLQGARAFYGIGYLWSKYGSDEIDEVDFMVKSLNAIADNSSPFSTPSEMSVKNIYRSFVPTVTLPFYDIAANTTYYGGKVYKDYEYLNTLPASQRYMKGVNPYLQQFTESLNRLAGGNENTSAGLNPDGSKNLKIFLDINPSCLEHLIVGYTGGVGKFGMDILSTINSMLPKGEPLNIRQVPIMNRFLTEMHSKSYALEFYQAKKQLDNLSSNINRNIRSGDIPSNFKYKSLIDLMHAQGDVTQKHRMFQSAERQIKMIDVKLEEMPVKSSGRIDLEKEKQKIMKNVLDAI